MATAVGGTYPTEMHSYVYCSRSLFHLMDIGFSSKIHNNFEMFEEIISSIMNNKFIIINATSFEECFE